MTHPQVNNRTLFTGDNLEVMRGFNSESVDLIYVSPPSDKKIVFSITEGDKSPSSALSAFDELITAQGNGNPLIEGGLTAQ